MESVLRRRHADALVALATEELRALVGVVAQGAEDRAGCREETVLAGSRCELAQAWPEDETSLHVARHEAVVLEGDRQSVCRWPGEAGGADELRQRGRACLEGAEYCGGLVENADSTRVVHALILTSQALRRQSVAPK
jgi:hypothetical protein